MSKAQPVVDSRAVERAVSKALASAQRQFDAQAAAQSKEIREAYRTLKLLAEAAQQRADALEKHLARPCAVKIPGGEIHKGDSSALRLATAAKPVLPHPRRDMSQSNGDGELKGPHRQILKALAELRSIGKDQPSRAQVAGWAGYSPKGGEFGNPLGRLSSLGYVIYPRRGTVALTDEGSAQAGEYPPPDQEEIQRRILHILRGPERKILAALMEHRTEVIPKTQLAEESGYSEGGGAFSNPLGALRSKGFIEYPVPGQARCAEWLFME